MRTDKNQWRHAGAMRWILYAAGALSIDQAIKALVLATAQPGGLITIAYNTGVTFGFLPGANTAMIIVSVIAIGALSYFATKSKGVEQLLFAIINGGVAGNLIDRALRGGVVDYLSVGTFPVFNLADTFIVCGVVGLLALELQNSSNSSKSSK